jgi:hypothetical protein
MAKWIGQATTIDTARATIANSKPGIGVTSSDYSI